MNIKEGKINQPACTSACPTGATIFGEREELIRIAKNRINTEADKYLDIIYGETEVGSTNVLYITAKDCPLDFLLYYNHRMEQGVNIKGLLNPNEPIPIMTK